MIEETEMNQQWCCVKRPKIESATLSDRNTAQVDEVGEKKDNQLRSGEGTMFSMFNPFRNHDNDLDMRSSTGRMVGLCL
jgi:hypothetical protein